MIVTNGSDWVLQRMSPAAECEMTASTTGTVGMLSVYSDIKLCSWDEMKPTYPPIFLCAANENGPFGKQLLNRGQKGGDILMNTKVKC